MLLLVGCAPRLLEVEPVEGSARGGQTVTFSGARLPEDPVVRFGEVEATVLSADREVIEVVLPPGVAGTVAVEVTGGRDRLATTFTYLPLELLFVEAPPHYLPEEPGSFVSVAAGDGDGDGLDEIALLEDSGRLALWRNTGLGALAQDAPVAGSVGGMVWVNLLNDGSSALFVCHDSGEVARLPELGLIAPADDEACTGARAADLDGDGVDEVIELREAGVRVWRVTDGGLARFDDTAEDAESCGELEGDGICEVSEGIAELTLPDGGSTWLTLPIPALDRLDEGLSLTFRGGPAYLTAVGASGGVATMLLESAEDWETRQTPPLREWTGVLPGRSLSSLSLTISGSQTTLELDEVLLRLGDGGAVLIADFATHPLEVALEGVRDVVAVEGGAVLGTASGAVLLDVDEDGIRRVSDSRLPGADCDVGALGTPDIDGDAVRELFIACADGQDRLYRTDGAGHWFDDTAGSLPVDAAAGGGVAVVDLDLDGLHDVVIANTGGVDRLYRADFGVLRDLTTRLSLEAAEDIGVIATDVEGDGDRDLLLVQGGGAPSRLFILSE